MVAEPIEVERPELLRINGSPKLPDDQLSDLMVVPKRPGTDLAVIESGFLAGQESIADIREVEPIGVEPRCTPRL